MSKTLTVPDLKRGRQALLPELNGMSFLLRTAQPWYLHVACKLAQHVIPLDLAIICVTVAAFFALGIIISLSSRGSQKASDPSEVGSFMLPSAKVPKRGIVVLHS